MAVAAVLAVWIRLVAPVGQLAWDVHVLEEGNLVGENRGSDKPSLQTGVPGGVLLGWGEGALSVLREGVTQRRQVIQGGES